MSKGKIILLTVLVIACAGVNGPRLFAKKPDAGPPAFEMTDPFAAENGSPDDSATTDPTSTSPSIAAEPSGESFDDIAAQASPPRSESTNTAATTQRDPGAPDQGVDARNEGGLAMRLANLASMLGTDRGRAASDESVRRRASRRRQPESNLEEEAKLERQRAEEARLMRERADAEAAAKTEAARLAAFEKEAAGLRQIPIHGILVSRRGPVARIHGYNLRVGQTIPGTRAVIESIDRDHLTARIDEMTLPLYLPVPGLRATKEEASEAPVEIGGDEEQKTPTATPTAVVGELALPSAQAADAAK